MADSEHRLTRDQDESQVVQELLNPLPRTVTRRNEFRLLDGEWRFELDLSDRGLAERGMTYQGFAPRFVGEFEKGVDYKGERKVLEDSVVEHAVLARAHGGYKISVHSGSDKFSIYPMIAKATEGRFHLKTAGTTWLEEVIGLAEAGGDGLALAKEIYAKALKKKDELCAPYATVIDIDAAKLPAAEAVAGWTSEQFVSALRHDPTNPAFNPHLRQLVHVGFKVAAQMGDRYLKLLEACEAVVSRNVTTNLYERHLRPLFVG